MSILALARTRRWLGWLAFTTLFAVVCVFLAQWQWARRVEVVAQMRVVAQNWDAAPVALSEVLERNGTLNPAREWTPVTVEGQYALDEQVLVRNRPFNARPGFEVLTPLMLDNGDVFIVNRGWLPVGSAQDSPDIVPRPPEGRVEVIARVKPGEPTIAGRGAPEGQIATIHLPDLAERIHSGSVITGAYGLLDSEDPVAPEQRPLPAPRPVNDEGPHLSYTFQWYLFALLGFVGFGWALRHEFRSVRAAETGVELPRSRRGIDAEEEDAILDAREH